MAKLPYEVLKDECMSFVEVILKIEKYVNEERFETYDEIMGRSVWKGCKKIEIVLKGEKERKLSREESTSYSKMFKDKHISNEYAEDVIVESDEENLEKANV